MLVNRVHKQYACRICGNAIGIKVCRCKAAYYCSKNCQKIDWKSHKSDCYQLVDHPKCSKQIAHNSSITTVECIASDSLQLEQSQSTQQISISTALSHRADPRERRQYDPTLMQYQQHQPLADTNTTTPSAIDDFEENLLNSLMYGVDDSTEEEILKNLNLTADELLAACNLDTETSSLNQQNTTGDRLFNEKIVEEIQRRSSFEYKPEYKETRDKLEKELSQFREIDLHEAQNQLSDEEAPSDIMISAQNPKYINHAKLDDHLLYK